MTNAPLLRRDPGEKVERATPTDEHRTNCMDARPSACDQTRQEASPGGQTRETEKSLGLQHPMSFPKHGCDVLLRQKIKHEVGYKPIARVLGLGRGRGAIRENSLRTRTKGGEALLGQFDHGGADINAPVARGLGQMLRQKAAGEPPGAAAELEHTLCSTELTVRDENRGGTILVERLRVLASPDAIVDAPSLFTR